MNSYDHQALDAIKCYHAKHDEYPRWVEATAGHRSKMTCTHFECEEPLQDRNVRVTRIPVVAVGTCDIVYRPLLVKSLHINVEQAKCTTYEKFHRLGAKLARAGCLILEPKESWGQQTYPPELFFSQIEVYVFGQEMMFEEVTAEEHLLPGD